VTEAEHIDDDDGYQVAPTNAALAARLRFIDFMLEYAGRVGRRAISDYFGVSIVQASLDLRAYRALAPENLVYDLTQRTYKATVAFGRRFP
jgi:hypothetical protein